MIKAERPDDEELEAWLQASNSLLSRDFRTDLDVNAALRLQNAYLFVKALKMEPENQTKMTMDRVWYIDPHNRVVSMVLTAHIGGRDFNAVGVINVSDLKSSPPEVYAESQLRPRLMSLIEKELFES